MKENVRPTTILMMWQPMCLSKNKSLRDPRTSNEIGTICKYLDVYNGALSIHYEM